MGESYVREVITPDVAMIFLVDYLQNLKREAPWVSFDADKMISQLHAMRTKLEEMHQGVKLHG